MIPETYYAGPLVEPDPDEFTQYRCPTCSRLYRRPANLNVYCTVLHDHGACCHFMETAVEDDRAEPA